LQQQLAGLPGDAVVRLVLTAEPPLAARDILTGATLPTIAPATMNIEVAWPRRAGR
jgi:hypothetical protein